MTITDLRRELEHEAADIPDLAEVRAEAVRRVATRQRRRRTQSLIAAAAAVVVIAGGASIAGVVFSHRSAGPAAPEPVVQVPDVPLPPDTRLIRHQLRPVTSPVTATPPSGMTGQIWISEPGALAVSFFDPGASGDSAFGWTSYTPLPASMPNPASPTAGYVITDERSESLSIPGSQDQSPPSVSRTSTTVSGHAATVDAAPAGTTDEFGFPASKRISWRLAGGRWIHVWANGSSGSGELASFAAGITKRAQTLSRTLGIGLTLPGLTVDSSINSRPVAGSDDADVFLCPPGVDPMGPSYGSASASASLNPDGSTTTHQTETEVDPSARCIVATAMTVPARQRASMKDGTTSVTVAGTVTHVSSKHQAAWADLDHGAIAVVRAPISAHLSDADLAALVASVRLSPAVTVVPMASGVFEGSAAGGAASAVASAATSDRAATSPTLSALPTAPTTIPAAPSSPGSMVAPTALPAGLPFGFTHTDRGWYSSWSVTPLAASGEATVMLDDGDAAGGLVRWRKAGPTGIPADATAVTVAGHSARQWWTQDPNGTVAHLAWTLPDGSGLELSNDPINDQDEATREVTAFAAVITDGSIPIPRTPLPRRTLRGFTEPRIAFTAGPGTGTAADDGGSGRSGPPIPVTAGPATLSTELCPTGTGPNFAGAPQGCLIIGRASADTAVLAASYDGVGAKWRVATVDGRTFYVSPDGRSVVTLDSAGSPVTAAFVGAAKRVSVATADLVAILLSIPG